MIWLDTLANGILLGGLYALFALGLSLTFGVMRLINLAHGDLILLGSYLIFFLASSLFLPPLLALLVALILMFALGWLLQRFVLNRALGGDLLRPLIVTFGLSILIANGLLALFSADSRRLNLGGLEAASLVLGPINVGILPLLTLLAAIACVIALNILFFRTKPGRAFRAASDDPVTLSLMGQDARKVFAIATGVAMAVSAVAAFFLATRASFDPSIGPARLLFAFEAVIIGGLGSFWGTLAGAIVLGVAQTVGGAFDPGWQILGGHLAFIAILTVRPRGLFPRAVD
ncbi:branched-chain amino acid ABC transporter permease [uncultured Nitratireductor sp.]|uniref:branched-chain amino acid ABC transporter permease n=1 Tax=uncultured Nitratireductor sp. TaxID=520953 RepID=UPI0025F1D7F0|nr:branched-chain amino acid ABC transporter permease [uncultured Nitratireductor sp.]